jgi:hypothetical protein
MESFVTEYERENTMVLLRKRKAAKNAKIFHNLANKHPFIHILLKKVDKNAIID